MPPRPADIQIQTVQASTLADSISVDLPRDGLAAVRAVLESGGTAVTVPDAAILAAIGELAGLAGIFAEPAGATAYAGLKALLAHGAIGLDERVVVLVTGSGLKDVASALRVAGEPTLIEPDLESVARELGV